MEDSFAMGYALGNDNTSSKCDSGWGADGGWLWILVIFALLGWGGNGFGGFGGGNGGYTATAATQADIQRGFDNSAVISKLDGLSQGLCDGFYAQNSSLMNGFHGVDNAVCQLGYQTQQGFNTLGAQLSSCCCETQRAIDGVKYQMATDTCAVQNTIQNTTRDILDNQNAGTRAILDFLTQDKISSLQAENQALKFQASQSAQNAFITANQDAQTAELIRRLGRDVPVPAYMVPNPNACYGNYGLFQQGGCSSCGC